MSQQDPVPTVLFYDCARVLARGFIDSNGRRVGVWTVFDETGRVVGRRDFSAR